MAAMSSVTANSLFHFVENFDVQSFTASGAKVCVVAVVGQTRLTLFSSKASMLNHVVDRDIFQGFESVLGDVDEKELECYYDSDTQVLYLHLLSHMDTPQLLRRCHQMAKAISKQEFYTYWQHSDFRFTKMLLLLFSVSHILLLVHPGSTFDVSNIKLFRILDAIRLKLQTPLCEMMQVLPVSKDWTSTGRLCSPRVLFVFQTSTFAMNTDEDLPAAGSKVRSQKLSPIKRLQHNLEDQIYRILRKSRVITNISNNSLFAIPANQEFVYIHCRKNDPTDPVSFILTQMRSSSGFELPRSKSYLITRPGNSSSDRLRSPLQTSRQENSFKEFLWQHIEMAFTKGFDDNVGRNPVAARFELPSAAVWFEVSQHIYRFLFEATPEGRAQTALNTLQSLLDTDLRFSESRCSKVMPMAETTYQQDLPPFYTTSLHLSRLAQAKRVFSQFARGPAYNKYLAQLEEVCSAFWRAGHQQCEAYSLSGNLCTNQRHRALSDPVTVETADLPVMGHSSQLKTRAACNCGRQQADKDDPFDHRSANYDFYMTLEAGCCGTLKHIDMPVFRPSTCEATAAATAFRTATDNKTSCHTEDVAEAAASTGGMKTDLVAGMSALSLALSLGQSAGSDLYAQGSCHDPELSQGHSQVAADVGTETAGHQEEQVDKGGEASGNADQLLAREANEDDENAHGRETNLGAEHVQGGEKTVDGDQMHEDAVHDSDGELEEVPTVTNVSVCQHSTTEYLASMIHTASPPGLLPKFPSWALCCLDTADCYNSMQGLDLPGFLPGSHFLLPWDIPLCTQRDRWPALGETTSKRGRNIRRIQKGPSEAGENTVRAYIGLEYECPRGHRFFCSAPDKVIKVLGSCTVKDTAHRLLNVDMPLYTPCHCRAGKGYLAQLMRAYAVTPDAPVRILLQPFVRPAPPPCPTFHTGSSEPFELPPAGIWVLRFPHVYMGENGAYNVPPDPQNLHASLLLKGLFAYREVASDG
ncbi:protein smg8-like isoform X2 [Pomacea canaliculata]|uniref:protein smg8-like isoform X2 n=1 Tax=Pomacea canaliculata TaxID=400727 RepID=UPI000D73517A|nr:protein smg8-like isoform X2 [Pomacea canaliculata]